jgi:tetratricopeptide (TPR) repeat protein
VAVIRWLKTIYLQVAKLPGLRTALTRVTWHYARARVPGMGLRQEFGVLVSAIGQAIQPDRRVDARYHAAKAILARHSLRELAEDYDRSGVLPGGTFSLLSDQLIKADLAAAEELLVSAINEQGDLSEIQSALGMILASRGEDQAATIQLLVAGTARPGVAGDGHRDDAAAKAYHEAGLRLAAKGLLRQAEFCHRRALEMDPHFGPAHLGYAQALAGRGEVGLAARHFTEYLVAYRRTPPTVAWDG